MNILPKKSWHVRSYKNIERVKRDEAQAAAEAKESQSRAALAEQEARTSLLRSKARNQLTSAPQGEECLAVQKTTEDSDNVYKHVDLFTDLASQKPQGEKNKEHEKEIKAAQEKYEKSIGLLTYLGQSSTEAQTTKPWYFKPPNRGTEKDNLEQSCTDEKRKASLDPILEMDRYLGVKERPRVNTIKPETTADVKKLASPSAIPSYCSTTGRHSTKRWNNSSSDDKKRKHHKSHHKHKSKTDKKESSKRRARGRHHDKSNDNKKSSHHKEDKVKCKERDYQEPNIQQLRAERLKREASERLKTSRLLSGQTIDQIETSGSKEDILDKPGRYNSQFHPELVRKKHKPFQFNMI